MRETTMPMVADVAAELAAIQTEVEFGHDEETESCDVRLQVYPDGSWAVRFGDSQYDLDHRGYWGAASISEDCDADTLRDIADDLIEQCQEMLHDSVDGVGISDGDDQ